MKYEKLRSEETSGQCSLCSAKFEVWLNNTGVSDEKKEKISQRLLNYCPACARADEKVKK